MSQIADLAQLLALRALREERAQAAVSAAAARLEDASRMVTEAEAALDAHDLDASERERRFFSAMHIRPTSENELGRALDGMHVANHRRDALVDKRNLAIEAVGECERQLASLREEWRARLAERDKLAEAHRRLRAVGRARHEAAAEQEAEDMGTYGKDKDRARLAC